MRTELHIQTFSQSDTGYQAIQVPVDFTGAFTVGALSGATDGQVNKVFRGTFELAASDTFTVDLHDLGDAMGQTIVWAEVHAVILVCRTPTATGTVTPGASNGWTGFGSAYSLPVSGKCPILLASAAGIAVSGSNKNITITNGAVAASYELYVVGRV